jgi:hypothetical protein
LFAKFYPLVFHVHISIIIAAEAAYVNEISACQILNASLSPPKLTHFLISQQPIFNNFQGSSTASELEKGLGTGFQSI